VYCDHAILAGSLPSRFLMVQTSHGQVTASANCSDHPHLHGCSARGMSLRSRTATTRARGLVGTPTRGPLGYGSRGARERETRGVPRVVVPGHEENGSQGRTSLMARGLARAPRGVDLGQPRTGPPVPLKVIYPTVTGQKMIGP